MADWRAIWWGLWVEFCSRFTLGKNTHWMLTYKHSSSKYQTCGGGGGGIRNEKFPQHWFAICLWRPAGTENQNTHVSSLISLWLLLLAAGPSSSIGSKCAYLTVCFCFQGSLPCSTHAPASDIKVSSHLRSSSKWWRVCCENVIKPYGQRKWSVLQAKQIGFIRREDRCLSYKSQRHRADSTHY